MTEDRRQRTDDKEQIREGGRLGRCEGGKELISNPPKADQKPDGR